MPKTWWTCNINASLIEYATSKSATQYQAATTARTARTASRRHDCLFPFPTASLPFSVTYCVPPRCSSCARRDRYHPVSTECYSRRVHVCWVLALVAASVNPLTLSTSWSLSLFLSLLVSTCIRIPSLDPCPSPNMSTQPLLQRTAGKRIALPVRVEPKVFFASG